MDDFESYLADEDLLFWVSPYELHRPDGKLFIHVCELQTGPKKGLFIAYPTILTRSGDRKYLATGSTLDEALKNCLEKIKGKPLSEIIPS